MGLQEWGAKQVRKRDLRIAMLETYFQSGMAQMLAATLRVTESVEELDEKILHQFEATLPEYLEALVSGLKESQANLWGFKGNVSEWTGSEQMVASGRVWWDNDRRERLTLAVTLIEPLEKRIRFILSKLKATYQLFNGLRNVEERISIISPEVKEDRLKSDHQLAQETRAALLSAIDTFRDNCDDHIIRLVDKAGGGHGLIKHSDVEKLKELAEKRVGAVMRKVLS